MRAMMIVLLLLLSIPAFAEMLVGGPCTYDDSPGVCTATGVNTEGKTLFTFEGTVSGERVSLADNEANEAMTVGTTTDCSLRFITSGTCTPCLFSIGSCGKEAWDAFRASAAAQRTEDAPAPVPGSGCALVARPTASTASL